MRTPEEVAREVGCEVSWNAAEDWTCLTHEKCWSGEDEWCPVAADAIRDYAAEVRAEVRAEELAVFRVVYTLAWDGEPSMSGEPHRMSAGELCLADARRALDFVGRRKDNPRIEGRMVGPWEPMP